VLRVMACEVGPLTKVAEVPSVHVKRLVVGVVVMLVGVFVAPSTGAAHTGFDYSLPTQDASVAEPIAEVTVAFTEPVTLVGNGFEVLNPQGEIVLPTPITDDDQVFRLILDPAIAGGEVGVRYEVTSLDGHVVDGGFSFFVDAPLPTTTVPVTTVPTTAAPVTTAAVTASPSTDAPSTISSTTISSTISSTMTVVDATVTSPTTASTTSDPDDEDSGSNTGIYIAIAAAIAVAGAAFVVVRARTSA
jgi:copper transport protein